MTTFALLGSLVIMRTRGCVRALDMRLCSAVILRVVFWPGASSDLPSVTRSASEYMWRERMTSRDLPVLVISTLVESLSLLLKSIVISSSEREMLGALSSSVSVNCENDGRRTAETLTSLSGLTVSPFRLAR